MICARPWRRLSEIRQLIPTWIWPALMSRVSPPEGLPRLWRPGLGSIDLTSLSSVRPIPTMAYAGHNRSSR